MKIPRLLLGVLLALGTTTTVLAQVQSDAALRLALDEAMESREWTEAFKAAEGLLAHNPRDNEALLRKAYALEQMKRYDEAIETDRELIDLIGGGDEAWNRLCWDQILAGQISTARSACERSLQFSARAVGPTVNIGHIYLLRGNPKQAYKWYERAQEILSSQKEFEDGPLADFDLFIAKGQEVAASRKARAWMVQRFNTPKYRASRRATKLAEEAWAFGRASAYKPALPLFLRAQALRQKHLGPESLGAIASLDDLGGIYYFLGREQESEAAYRHALALREKHLPVDHYELSYTLEQLAALYEKQGRYAESVICLKRVVGILENLSGARHPQVAARLDTLSKVYQKMGRFSDAEATARFSLMIREKDLGAGHPAVAASLVTLAKLYRDTDRFAEAEALYLRAIDIAEHLAVPGSDEIYYAERLRELARLYQKMGHLEDAEARYISALFVFFKQSQAPDNAVDFLGDLADLERQQGHARLAIFFRKQAIFAAQTLDYRYMQPVMSPKRYLSRNGKHYQAIADVLTQLGQNNQAKEVFDLLENPRKAMHRKLPQNRLETDFQTSLWSLSNEIKLANDPLMAISNKCHGTEPSEVDLDRSHQLRHTLDEKRVELEALVARMKAGFQEQSASAFQDPH